MMYSVNRDILAFDSAKGLREYIQNHGAVDIVLSEARLPDAPDFDLLKMTKTAHPATFFIVLSSNPADESTAEALKADAFLAKPFSLKDLFRIVERFVVDSKS